MNTHEPQTWISAAEAAALSNLTVKTIVSRIKTGQITGKLCDAAVFSADGQANYLVLLESLSQKTQYKYHVSKMAPERIFHLDLVSLKGVFGTNGLSQFEKIAELLQKAAVIRNEYRSSGKLTEKLKELAESYGISLRTLTRYEKREGYAEISKLYLDPTYMQHHQPDSMCLLSIDYAYFLKLSKHRHYSNADIFRALIHPPLEHSCDDCVYKEGSAARKKYVKKTHDNIPVCRRDSQYMLLPGSRYVIDDLLRHIPEPLLVFRREGVRSWNARYGHFILRDKPLLINDLLQGDHHVFNCFVRVPIRKTVSGRIIEKEVLFRPVLTAWMDTASGVITGWIISLLPNRQTIAEAFCRGCVYSVGDEFHGLPRAVLIDNGKDYRSKLLEDVPEEFKDLVPTNDALTNKFLGFGLLPSLNIEILHSMPYHPQSKSIERFFGVIEEIWISKIPGWCYESADKRPPGFQRDLERMWKAGELWTLIEFVHWFRTTLLPEYHKMRHYDTPRVVEPLTPDEASTDPWDWHTPTSAMSPLELYRSLPKARDLTPTWKTMAALKMERKPNVACDSHGIQFSGEYYWSDELRWFTNFDEKPTQIDILYNKPIMKEEAPLSITVLYNNKFVCEAPIVGHSEFTDADPQLLQEHYDDRTRYQSETQGIYTRIYKVIKHSKLVDKEYLRFETYGPSVDKQKDASLATDLTTEAYQEVPDTENLIESKTEDFMEPEEVSNAYHITREEYHRSNQLFYGDLEF